MDLSIIIVNWNAAELLIKCIDSIRRQTKQIKYEIIIYDNNSSDNSYELITSRYPEVIYIYSDNNLGFSIGNNKAFDKASGKYVLFLNPDTIILDRAIEKAYNYIKNLHEKSLIGCKLLNGDGTLQYSSAKFPTVNTIITGKYPLNSEMHNKNHEAEWIMGAFMIISSDFFDEIGKFDEDYFMYSEDMNLCYNVKKYGGKVYYYSESTIIHYYNQSGKKMWSSKRGYKIKQSINLFIKKNYQGTYGMFCNIIYNFRFYVKVFLNFVLKHFRLE